MHSRRRDGHFTPVNKSGSNMKHLVKTLAMIGLTSALAVATSQAQAPKLVTFDELGNGFYAGNTLPATIATDPFSGLATLRYTLPFAASLGDVVMFEPGPSPQQFTDILRFDGSNHVYFFSERETSDVPPFDPADGPLPALIAAMPTVFIQEVGPEGNNGAFYTPNAGDPGFELTVGNLQYHFISDVPEPTMGLLGLAGLTVFMGRKALQKKASRI
jgi:hypothetical protein